ncbi:MAG TPA: outer membrane lipid asymmetry maintenance protein MlaD [Chromatiales bacterium]|nr:outer membrane lipid asymmetry maintenance protein MlaD [Thiotrichales bacterium]HIP69358.1 outer membrane lipid asymmetry maintenance protein MlaD [Chromatiales bacterium]
MKTTRTQEIWVGLFVALGFAALFILAMKMSNFASYKATDVYRITVLFENIGGLKPRSPVTVSGVRVGRVESIDYDPNELQAKVVLAIENGYNFFPVDTQASIYTSGLLGEQYIALEPGAEDEMMKEGGRIRHSQSALVLEELVGQVLVNLTSK